MAEVEDELATAIIGISKDSPAQCMVVDGGRR
jgi:hypothetical protein